MVLAPERMREAVPEVQPEEILPEARLVPSPRKSKKWLYLAVIAIGIVAIAAVAFFVITREDSTNPMTTPVEEVTGGGGMEIQTASGTFTISDVVSGDRYPEGCADGDMSCNVAMPGYQVLVLELTPATGSDVGDITSEGADAYIVSTGGTRTDSFLFGWSLNEDDVKEGMVGFTPEASASSFTLHWPGNDPIDLDL